MDFQCHIFPRGFIEKISDGSHQIRALQPDEWGRRFIADKATSNILTYFIEGTSFTDVGKHLHDMRKYGIDIQVLSVNPPGVDRVRDPREALELSRVINDGLQEIVEGNPGLFLALATVPMNNASVALEETERAVKTLGFRGINISSNTLGRYYDSDEFESLFSTFETYDVPVFVHPTEPVVQEKMGWDYNLPLVFGWPFDTTISVSRLVFAGVMERHPRLKIVAAHGGGMIPFYGGRMRLLLQDMRGKGIMPVDGSVEMLRKVYYDAALFDESSIELLIRFAGSDRVIYGSDYPFGGENGRRCYRVSTDVFKRLRTRMETKEKILWKNAARLLGL